MPSLELIKRLVQFNTVSRDSNLPLIDFISEYLDDHGIRSYRVESESSHRSQGYGYFIYLILWACGALKPNSSRRECCDDRCKTGREA